MVVVDAGTDADKLVDVVIVNRIEVVKTGFSKVPFEVYGVAEGRCD